MGRPILVIVVVFLCAAVATASPPDAGVEGGAGDGGAAPAAPEDEPTGPAARVVVGVYVNQIQSIDLKQNQFTIDFWIWFRWTDPDPELKPLETFEIIGGHVDSKESTVEEDLGGGTKYAAARVVATVTKFFDVSRFPLDDHSLSLFVEDSENEDHKLVYVPDRENSRLDPGVTVPGWGVAGSTTHLSSHTYTTNYGDTTLPADSESTYSRFELRVRLERQGSGYMLKLFWGVYLATMIALLAFFIKPTDLDPRFGLGIGAVFAAMASAYIIGSALPDTNLMTLADKVNMLAIAYIFLSLVGSTISLKVFYSGREDASKRLDWLSFWALLGSYAVLNVVVLL